MAERYCQRHQDAGDQVSHGNPFFGAEVTLLEGNKQIGRYIVSVGATPLKD